MADRALGNPLGNPLVLKNKSSLDSQVGSISFFDTDPGVSYLASDGSICLQSDYPKLFEVIGLRGEFGLAISSQPSLGATRNWVGSAYGSNIFIAIASNDIAYLTSPDGSVWTSRNTLGLYGPLAIVYGDGKFVVVGGTSSKVSVDGINWSSGVLPTGNNYAGITYGDGKFLAIPLSGTQAAISIDGINWAVSTLPSSGAWRQITYGDGVFLAIHDEGAVISTDGGTTWQVVSLPASAGGTLGSCTFGGGVFVICRRNSNQCYYSSDGKTWISSSLPQSGVWQSVVYGDGVFLAFIRSAAVFASSADGRSWTSRTLGTSANWNGSSYGNYSFVAVADGGAIAAKFPRFNYNPLTEFSVPSVAAGEKKAYIRAK